jgi:Flp pilus assembly protein TadG
MGIKRGQALVETALIAPILVFLLIGVWEVGWALRGYLVLANANREAARFAVRPHYLNYDEQSYINIVNHAITSISNQIPFTTTGTTQITAVRIDTQLVCDPFKRDENNNLICDCDKVATQPYSPTIVISHLTNPTMTFKYPLTSSEKSKIDWQILIQQLIVKNRRFNCNLMLRGFTPTIDESVYVEMWFHQDQLFGFPLISNPFTDPVPMYAHSVFRKLTPTRED